MNDVVTTLMEASAMVGVAVGVGAGSAEYLGWWGVAIGGVVLYAQSVAVALVGRRTASELT